jgi:hypothetical protein
VTDTVKVAVVVESCHDDTAWDMFLTPDQLEFMQQVAAASQLASAGDSCRPKMRLVLRPHDFTPREVTNPEHGREPGDYRDEDYVAPYGRRDDEDERTGTDG